MSNTNWSTENIPNMAGHIIVITGANSGIGFEAAKELTRKGAHVVMACRSMEKAANALQQLQKEVAGASAEIMPLDLASLASIHQFADAFKAKYDKLDILINNAGIMMVPYGTTEDGFERQFGTNHLGHFALTGLLMAALQNANRARVVTISSIGHTNGAMDFDDMMFAGGVGYERMKAYGRSKLANLLFTYELQRRLTAAGSDVLAVAAHPGISNTALADHLLEKYHIGFLKPVVGWLVQSAEMGALPTLRAAVDPAVQPGSYYGPDGKDERKGYPVVVQSNAASHNATDARRLWELSQQLTNVHYLDEQPAVA